MATTYNELWRVGSLLSCIFADFSSVAYVNTQADVFIRAPHYGRTSDMDQLNRLGQNYFRNLPELTGTITLPYTYKPGPQEYGDLVTKYSALSGPMAYKNFIGFVPLLKFPGVYRTMSEKYGLLHTVGSFVFAATTDDQDFSEQLLPRFCIREYTYQRTRCNWDGCQPFYISAVDRVLSLEEEGRDISFEKPWCVFAASFDRCAKLAVSGMRPLYYNLLPSLPFVGANFRLAQLNVSQWLHRYPLVVDDYQGMMHGLFDLLRKSHSYFRTVDREDVKVNQALWPIRVMLRDMVLDYASTRVLSQDDNGHIQIVERHPGKDCLEKYREYFETVKNKKKS